MSPENVVDRAYELISFAAGGEPAWPEFRALFTEPCVLALRVFPDDDAVTVMDLDGYVVHQMRDGLSDEEQRRREHPHGHRHGRPPEDRR